MIGILSYEIFSVGSIKLHVCRQGKFNNKRLYTVALALGSIHRGFNIQLWREILPVKIYKLTTLYCQPDGSLVSADGKMSIKITPM